MKLATYSALPSGEPRPGLVVDDKRIIDIPAALGADDGTRTMLSDWSGLALTEQTPTGATVTPVEQEDVPELLATRFALPGYALSKDGRLTVAPEG